MFLDQEYSIKEFLKSERLMNMNFTTSFDEFAKGLSTTDLMLYAGVGIVIWVLFKDKLSPVQQFLLGLKDTVLSSVKNTDTKSLPVVSKELVPPTSPKQAEDIFFQLVVSWKQTRDLAEKSGCAKAVEVADQMFPFLSPTVCANKENL